MDGAPALELLSPMLLTQRSEPFCGADWAFEVKFDGYRAVAEFGNGRSRILSRHGSDMTAWFPEIALALASVQGGRYVVDGEVCVLNDAGVAGDAEFRQLFRRQARRGYRVGDVPVTLCAFDLLVHRGRSCMHLPYAKRKAMLSALLPDLPRTRVVPHFIRDGNALFKAAVGLELEGIVGKRLDSIYAPGVRSANWVKIKRPGAVPAERFRRGV